MYLSRVEIDRQNRQKMRQINHLGAIHSWVESCFPDEIEEGRRSRKLWRIDFLHNALYLLIVSEERPDKARLERFGIEGTGESKDYDSFLKQIEPGMRAIFRVTLNPVVAKKEEGIDRGVTRPLNIYQQKDFLLERSEKNGFILREDDFAVVDRRYLPLFKKGARPIQLSSATYEGVLTVSDGDLFRQTLTQGFGKKKAYGFGLMTIIPET